MPTVSHSFPATSLKVCQDGECKSSPGTQADTEAECKPACRLGEVRWVIWCYGVAGHGWRAVLLAFKSRHGYWHHLHACAKTLPLPGSHRGCWMLIGAPLVLPFILQACRKGKCTPVDSTSPLLTPDTNTTDVPEVPPANATNSTAQLKQSLMPSVTVTTVEPGFDESCPPGSESVQGGWDAGWRACFTA